DFFKYHTEHKGAGVSVFEFRARSKFQRKRIKKRQYFLMSVILRVIGNEFFIVRQTGGVSHQLVNRDLLPLRFWIIGQVIANTSVKSKLPFFNLLKGEHVGKSFRNRPDFEFGIRIVWNPPLEVRVAITFFKND